MENVDDEVDPAHHGFVHRAVSGPRQRCECHGRAERDDAQPDAAPARDQRCQRREGHHDHAQLPCCPIAEPVSSAPTASWSIGQTGVPAIEEAISTTQAPENSRLRPALAMNQGRSASASPRSRAAAHKG
jgi:hypothetical protein